MTIHVALLRAVNVAGKNSLPMAKLREMVEGAGYRDVRTVLQSGNVIFGGAVGPTPSIERRLERACKSELGLETDFLVRTAEEWRRVVERNPFPGEAEDDPGHLLVMFLKESPGTGKLDELRKAIVGRERVEGDGKHLYIVYPDGVGRSKLTTALMDRKLGARGTGRNWNTVLKLAALCEQIGSARTSD